MSKPGDVVWAGGKSWTRSCERGSFVRAKTYWHNHEFRGHLDWATLKELKQFDDFVWLVKNSHMVSDVSDQVATLQAELDQAYVEVEKNAHFRRHCCVEMGGCDNVVDIVNEKDWAQASLARVREERDVASKKFAQTRQERDRYKNEVNLLCATTTNSPHNTTAPTGESHTPQEDSVDVDGRQIGEDALDRYAQYRDPDHIPPPNPGRVGPSPLALLGGGGDMCVPAPVMDPTFEPTDVDVKAVMGERLAIVAFLRECGGTDADIINAVADGEHNEYADDDHTPEQTVSRSPSRCRWCHATLAGEAVHEERFCDECGPAYRDSVAEAAREANMYGAGREEEREHTLAWLLRGFLATHDVDEHTNVEDVLTLLSASLKRGEHVGADGG